MFDCTEALYPICICVFTAVYRFLLGKNITVHNKEFSDMYQKSFFYAGNKKNNVVLQVASLDMSSVELL